MFHKIRHVHSACTVCLSKFACAKSNLKFRALSRVRVEPLIIALGRGFHIENLDDTGNFWIRMLYEQTRLIILCG